ncbi:MAG: sigma factor-like helix-turn-helix DNA-binding protein [Allosphingosinicella sp.]|uniref:sigma factor-like helix-turn-helix DNA-binding protein n=1 Tax=Allosphingosinicella sp. TaxID=2823234 RepID=UPI00395CAC39
MDRPSELSERELIARMGAIVRGMPRLTREIFMAHRLDDMPYEEIARRTGLTTRQVEKHIAHAILYLDRGLHRDARPWWKFW